MSPAVHGCDGVAPSITGKTATSHSAPSSSSDAVAIGLTTQGNSGSRAITAFSARWNTIDSVLMDELTALTNPRLPVRVVTTAATPGENPPR